MGRNESDAEGISRRELLGAAGGAAGAAVLGGTLLGATPAGAATGGTSDSSEPGASGQALAGGIIRSNPSPTTPGFEYLLLNYADFSARDAGASRVYNSGGDFSVSNGGTVVAGVHLPVGAVVKELEAYTTNGVAGMTFYLVTHAATGGTVDLFTSTVPASAGTVTTTLAVDHTAVATASLVALFQMGSATNTSRGMRIGYLPRSKVVLIPTVRVWDTREPGGAPGDGPLPPVGAVGGPQASGAVVTLTLGGYRGIPAGVSGLACVLTIITPTAGGFIRAYPGGGAVPLGVVGNFPAGAVTGFYPLVATGTVGANAGKVTIAVGGGSAGVHLGLDITGYIT